MNLLQVVGDILILIGSLGIFLYGMKLMSEALQKIAGNKMRSILSAMTSNRLKGVFTGFIVTSVIQSSSATTVMIVSFVNAGLLSLIEAIGVIMGANIGTTITAWLISILGFKIHIDVFAIGLVGICFPLLFAKHSKRKSWGEFVIGFAVLFIGLQFLKDAVPDIKQSPEILEFLSAYTNMGFGSILIFVFIGTLLTIVIQSSSATMALTLVMCYNGWISFELAAAMVLGENIGTTVTANIAAAIANVTAKRAARAHFLFNMVGIFWILLLFRPFLNGIDGFVVNMNGASPFVEAAAMPIALSIFHTTFNIINTTLLVWFAPLIAQVATKMVPQKEDDDEEFRLKHIGTGLLSTSELSTLQAKEEIASFGKRVEKMFDYIPQLLDEKKNKKINKIVEKIGKYEQITDNMEEEIALYLTKISESKLSHEGSLRIRVMLKIIDDLESVGDVCFQISKTIDNMFNNSVSLTKDQRKQLDAMIKLVKESLIIMNYNLENQYNNIIPKKAIDQEEKINKFRNKLRQKHVEDLKEKKYKHKIGTFYSELISLNEKLADYVINVSEAIIEYNEG